ncbi:NUMOD4 domain-containing protein [Kiloniella majae]|uniref:NUMOD4 domain-containing protein n=1 Tax=Kiloniella majae TaxID=1938558 RepID=UPI000A2792FD|nr:NUMOD4 domain-containing protein [Kiloniella majae]
MEVWKEIAGFPNYQVSSRGNVRRVNTGRILKPGMIHGYLLVTLRRDNRSFTKRIHVLVSNAFNGQRPSKRHQAAHNDGVKTNNAAKNIRWATPEENQADRKLHGTDIKGSHVFGAKLKEADIPRIRTLLSQHVPCGVIANAWGVHKSTIHLINKNKIWTHAS